jgi:hypothetical protein
MTSGPGWPRRRCQVVVEAKADDEDAPTEEVDGGPCIAAPSCHIGAKGSGSQILHK